MGLGNPGPGYLFTRHNAGFMAVDAACDAWGFPRFRRPWRWRARVSEGELGGEPLVIVKPQTHMNRSGTALGPLIDRDDWAPARDLLIVVDDAALPLGRIRLRPRGSAGGHNGLKSVAGRLQSEEYARLRIGVGPKPDDVDQSDFVLEDFDASELDAIKELLPTLVDAMECWAVKGIDTAMNEYNRRGSEA